MYNLLHKESTTCFGLLFGHLQVDIELNFSKQLYLNYLGIYIYIILKLSGYIYIPR